MLDSPWSRNNQLQRRKQEIAKAYYRIIFEPSAPAGTPEAATRGLWRPFAARFGLIYLQYLRISGCSADSKIARGLLHSRAAFGIALRIAGE